MIDLLEIRDLIDSLDVPGSALDSFIKGVVLVPTFVVHITNGGHGFRPDESLGLSRPRLNLKLYRYWKFYFFRQFPAKLFGFSPRLKTVDSLTDKSRH